MCNTKHTLKLKEKRINLIYCLLCSETNKKIKLYKETHMKMKKDTNFFFPKQFTLSRTHRAHTIPNHTKLDWLVMNSCLRGKYTLLFGCSIKLRGEMEWCTFIYIHIDATLALCVWLLALWLLSLIFANRNYTDPACIYIYIYMYVNVTIFQMYPSMRILPSFNILCFCWLCICANEIRYLYH